MKSCIHYHLYIRQNRMFKIIVTMATLCLLVLADEEAYTKVIHNSDENAKCLDGTSPALYFHQGGDTTKFLVFFIGGGYCEGTSLGQVVEECYKRSKSDLGSSKDLPPILYSPGGYLSTQPEFSKFATWTKIIIFYCDGAHHQGYNANPLSYKDVILYFRGQANTKSHFKWISSRYNFAGAEKVLLTGASSGGIATFSYSNYVRSLLNDPNVLYTVADSGAFVNASSPFTGLYDFSEQAKTLFKVSNTGAASPIQTCNKHFEGEEYKCLFLQHSFPFIEGRMMVINSQYDEVGLQGIGIDCLSNIPPTGKTMAKCNSTQLGYIEAYRKQFLSFASNFSSLPRNSIWSISCSSHSFACYKERYDVSNIRVPSGGVSPREAIDKFVFQDEQVLSVDEVAWPGNLPCAY